MGPLRNATGALPNLDALRALAITLVVLDHTLLVFGVQRFLGWQTWMMGLFGVYLFFVHTSLVLMWSLERRPNVLDFYVRRAFRIYPLAVVLILMVAFSHAAIGGFFEVVPWTARSLMVNLALMNEVVKNYPLVYGVTWSLGPEVLMYVLLPALFFYARSVRRVWPLLVLWCLVVLCDHHVFPTYNQGNSFFVLIPDFLAGVMAYVAFMRMRAVAPAWLFLPVILLLFAGYMQAGSIRGDWPVCLAVALLLPRFRQLAPGWFTRTTHRIAEHSYGLYLLHPIGLLLGRHMLPRSPAWVQLAVFLGFTSGTTMLAYRYFERPLILLGARVAARLAAERPERPAETLEPAP